MKTTLLPLKRLLMISVNNGLTINLVKSKVFFSENTPETLKHTICHTIGISSTTSLRKYLGFPINTNLTTTNNYQSILTNLDNRLSG